MRGGGRGLQSVGWGGGGGEGLRVPRPSGGSTAICVPDELERCKCGYAAAGKECQRVAHGE